MKPNDENQYIVRFVAENFKKITIIDFVPNRYVTTITGANGAGKTSALDAMFCLLLGRKTLSPSFIQRGKKKGYLYAETNTHGITRHLNDAGGNLEIVHLASGRTEPNPADWLEDLAANMGFDPLRFTRIHADEQFKELMSLIDLEADIEDLEARNEADTKTLANRRDELRRMEAARDHIAVDKTLPTETAKIEDLLREAREASEHNETLEQERRRRQQIQADQQRRGDAIREKRRQIAQLQSELENMEAVENQTNITMKEWEPLEEPRDRAALDQKVSEATRTNSAIATNNANRAQWDRFDQDIEAMKTETENMKEAIRSRTLAIAAAMDHAKFPIPGLGFETLTKGSGERDRKIPKKIITYNGVPLADASSAEQIRVSAAIGMVSANRADKPKLRFMIIRDGSLLDDNGMMVLEQMAHENDFQIWMEKVDTSGKVGIYMEDGTIKTVNKEPVPAAAKPAKAEKPAKKATGKKIAAKD